MDKLYQAPKTPIGIPQISRKLPNIGVKILDIPQAQSGPPRVFISLREIQKIKYYTDLVRPEINGLGFIERQGNDFIISEAFILKQTTVLGGLHVDIISRAYNRYITELVNQGGDPGKIKFQWHSHADAPVFFSPDDLETIAGYLNDFMISLVINKRGECICRLDLFKPFKLSMEIPLFVILSQPPIEIMEHCQQEVKEKVKVKFSLRQLGLYSKERLGEELIDQSFVINVNMLK